MESTPQPANAYSATPAISQAPTARRVRVVPLTMILCGIALTVGHARGVKQENSPMHHVQVAIHASASTPTMAVSASHASQEQSQTQPPLQTTALVALFEEMLSSRQWELRARNAHREDSQTKLEVPASTVQQVSTARVLPTASSQLGTEPQPNTCLARTQIDNGQVDGH